MTKPSRLPEARRKKYAQKHAFTQYVDLGDFDAMIAGLEGDVAAAVRPAAQASTEVLYQAVKNNLKGRRTTTGSLAAAIYQVFSDDNSKPGKAVYHISWNARTAPHGHLVEFGHIQRYKVYVGKDGKWYTAVRAEMRGKPKPRRSAPQSVKDAYYVLLPNPKQVAAQPFIRPAMYRAGEAAAAGRKKFFEVLDAK